MFPITLLKLLLLITILYFHYVEATNYCDLAVKPQCIGTEGRHVGCEETLKRRSLGRKSYSELWPAFTDKEFFTDKLNNFRLELSQMKHGIFPKTVANMKVVTWDEELQYFAVNSLKYLHIDAPKFCYASGRYTQITKLTQYYYVDDSFRNEHALPMFYQTVSEAVVAKNKRVERLSAIIDAQTESVGCAYMIYSIEGVEKKAVVVLCLFNQSGGRNTSEVYESGEVCTKCHALEMCSNNPRGLCVYRHLVGEPIDCSTIPFFNLSMEDVQKWQCDKVEDVKKLNIHFQIIYSFLFVALCMHVLFFRYYSRYEI